jgi:light-regulated signal transduction histidine kinase (bacteriophytochrome)
MAIINGAAEVLLADESLPERVRERMLRIERAAREMAEITAALLVMAREEQAAVQPRPLCQVDEVLGEAVEKHRYLLKNKPVEVEVDIEARPCLAVERPVLGMALGNLIRNAFSYTEGGRIQVRPADRVVVRTRAPASGPRSWGTSSSATTGALRAEALEAGAPASASPWSSASATATAGKSRSRASRGAAPG